MMPFDFVCAGVNLQALPSGALYWPAQHLLAVDEFAEVEEQPDGSAIVRMDEFEGPLEDEDFYQNLAERIPSWDLQRLAMQYIDLIESLK